MKLLYSLLMLGMLAGTSAHAQLVPGLSLGDEKQLTAEEKARIQAQEEAARAAADRVTPRQKTSSDPWAGARGTPSSADQKQRR